MLGSAQVDFRLVIRKEDLVLVSMKQVEQLQTIMATITKSIIDNGYLVKLEVTASGVTTLTKE